MNPSIIKYILELVPNLINSSPITESTRKLEAIEALTKALNETKSYYGSLKGIKLRQPKGEEVSFRWKQEQLTNWWTIASTKIRQFDNELADRCYQKGTYWADPTGYDVLDIKYAEHQIHAIEAELLKILHPNKYPRAT